MANDTWTIRHADGSVIGRGDTFRAAALEALAEEITDNDLDPDSLSDSELQGTLDTNDFSAEHGAVVPEHLGELAYDLPDGHRAESINGLSSDDVQEAINAARRRGAKHVRWSRNDNATVLVDAEDLRDLGR